MDTGNFTLPGEAGYEALTLALAKRWGADVIRDSDGTTLSPEILEAGYDIYSTICPIRDHNAWIKRNLHTRQQCFLCGKPEVATGDTLSIRPLDGFYSEQFALSDGPDALAYWQVYDRTAGKPLPADAWQYNQQAGTVHIQAVPFHRYTVSFLAYRIWEEISMYNHVTNSWNREHLMQLNPYHPEARAYLRDWLTEWCKSHPDTNVVRFTSLFYNFAWIWGADARNRNLFTDWASYDFTVCPAALSDFAKQVGYELTAEDFVRGGKYFSTHCPPDQKKRDWMAFIGAFVRDVGRELVEIVHQAGKQAYVFYDDSWVGLEPYSGHFKDFGFDGIIKCVFSGYEVRLCAGVPAKTHEIRFHPYLFPTGLGGAPTFSPGGDPARDAMRYWVSVRRALLRAKIERAGLGGYLHLVDPYPAFVDAMDTILREFRAISRLHDEGAPLALAPRVGILHAWGTLRTWTLSGHFHETDNHVLIHVLESLSGLPFDVKFLSFDDVRGGVPESIDVLINAGEEGSAWSGADAWADETLVATLTEWVHRGGVFLGIDAPSAAAGGDTCLRMAHVLGVDLDHGERSCHGRWPIMPDPVEGLIPPDVALPVKPSLYLIDGQARVLAARDNHAVATQYVFGKGAGLYLTGFTVGPDSTRFLQNLLLYAAGQPAVPDGVPDNPSAECAIYPAAGKAVVINNTDGPQRVRVAYGGKIYGVELPPYGMEIIALEA